jgi:hypothetical protein
MVNFSPMGLRIVSGKNDIIQNDPSSTSRRKLRINLHALNKTPEKA